MFHDEAEASQPLRAVHSRIARTTAGPPRRGTGTGRPNGRAGEAGSRSHDHTGQEKPE